MAGSKHTPGTWRLDPTTDADGTPSCLVFAEVEPGISEVVAKASKRFSEYEANARLIAAGPDLLKALKEVVAISDRDHAAWRRARAAIAKAEGRS